MRKIQMKKKAQKKEVIVKRKKPKDKKEKSYSELADMSLNEQIKKKLQEEKITCFFNQLTGKKFN